MNSLCWIKKMVTITLQSVKSLKGPPLRLSPSLASFRFVYFFFPRSIFSILTQPRHQDVLVQNVA